MKQRILLSFLLALPLAPVAAEQAACATAHPEATAACVEILEIGGNAVDASIAANAVLTVTSQHMCGLGGDLFALVHMGTGPPACLNASGRAGSGADPAALLAEGSSQMPHRGDVRSIPVPGCADGWWALHQRFGSLPMADLLAPAIHLATDGFAASPLLAGMAVRVREVHGAQDFAGLTGPGSLVTRPGVAAVLRSLAEGGRDGVYLGAFGEELLAVGDGVQRFKAGQRVMGLTGYGAFAEAILVPENQLIPVPDGMNDHTAAAFSMVYGTSYHALKQRANIQPGETLLVLGASGGVGLAAVELGKAMGATVIACASSEEKLAVAKEAGADDLINYAEEDLKDALKQRYPKGVDVIYDPVGDKFTEAAIRNMAWNGRLLIVGFAAGDIPKIPANLALLKGCSIVGVFWGAFTQKEPQTNIQNIMELMQLFNQGKINPRISQVFPFEDYEQALAALTSRTAKGKVVLDVAGD